MVGVSRERGEKEEGPSSTSHLGLVLYILLPRILVTSEEFVDRSTVRVSSAYSCRSTALAGHKSLRRPAGIKLGNSMICHFQFR